MKRHTPGGRGGGGVPHFGPYPEHSRLVNAEKVRSIPHLCAHLLHWLERRFAAKGSGDPDGIAAFLFLLLNQVYAFEGYWTAKVNEGLETLVMGGFHFGNGRESASQRVGESASRQGKVEGFAPQVRRRSASRSEWVRHPPTLTRTKAARQACGPGCVQRQAAKRKISACSYKRESHPGAPRASVHRTQGPRTP